jgi:hypothetical protein
LLSEPLRGPFVIAGGKGIIAHEAPPCPRLSQRKQAPMPESSSQKKGRRPKPAPRSRATEAFRGSLDVRSLPRDLRLPQLTNCRAASFRAASRSIAETLPLTSCCFACRKPAQRRNSR